MSKQPRPSTKTKTIANLIRARAFGFDRLSAYADHPKPALPVKRIRNHCGELVIIENHCLPYQSLWQSHVSIQQPGPKAIRLLAAAFREGNIHNRPFYGEIAVDFITATPANARQVGLYFLEHMLVPHCRDQVIREGRCTFYFHRLADIDGNKRAHVTVLYWDLPSDLAGEFQGQPCCHIEHRYSGADALGNLGINCMADFALFSHDAFWRKTLKLASLPGKTEIGRFLRSGKTACSDPVLWKCGNRFLEDFYLKDALVLQNIRQAHPKIHTLLRRVSNNIFLSTKN